MNVRSKYAEGENAVPKSRRNTCRSAMAGSNTDGRGGVPVGSRIGQAGGLFDMIFEKLGIKKEIQQAFRRQRITPTDF